MVAVSTEILDRHLSDAAFLWGLRDAAVRDPAYTIKNLGDLDERVAAHLDGLVVGDDAGWEMCKAALDEPNCGVVFTAMFVAVTRRDLRGVADVLNAGADSVKLLHSTIAALGWASFADVNRVLPGLLDPRCPWQLHYVGIGACSAHRRDPGPALSRALHAEAPLVRARALRAIGQLGRVDLKEVAVAALSEAELAPRFWAAWSGALFGEAKAVEILSGVARAEGDTGYEGRACETAMRGFDASRALGWLQSSSNERVALAGAAALGDPALIPWLFERMAMPVSARLAGAAFQRITGLDLSLPKLRASLPEGFQSGPTDDPEDDDVAMDPDESLPWPNPAALEAWWSRRSGDFKNGTRYLLGKPVSTEGWLDRVLRNGSQPARLAAAEEMSMRGTARALFEVRAPASRQRMALL